jgi:excisionase family DNA binding protein
MIDANAKATLDAAEVASLLRIDKKLVYELVRRNELPGVLRLGRVIRFSRAAILRLIDGC